MNAQERIPYAWQRGAALVEFAAVIPLLILLLLGSVELGRYVYFGILVGNAAHAGAAYGAYSTSNESNTAGMEAAVTADAQGFGGINATTTPPSTYCQCWDGSTGTTISCTSTCTTGSEQVWVSVTATGTYTPLFSYPGLPTSWTVSRTANMMVIQ